MTIDLRHMSIDLTYQDSAVRIPHGSDNQLLVAKTMTTDFFTSRTALALGAGWLGLIVGLLIGR